MSSTTTRAPQEAQAKPSGSVPAGAAAKAHAGAPPNEKHAASAAHGEGAHGGNGGHGGRSHGKREEEHKHHGPPPWLISFGDMMTLFLCFFIILVTMAPTQDAGLTAAGLGPFVVALESGGMDGALTGERQLQRVNMYRERFGLEALSEDQFRDGRLEVRDSQEISMLLKSSLKPFAEMRQPLLARFETDSAELSDAAKTYLDALAETLRPGYGQLLLLEGHALDAGPRFRESNAWLAVARSQSVKHYLVDHHGFVPQRLEARAWATERSTNSEELRCVDARLVEPRRES
ncbi:MAG TPA: flagellar motor protein MotB [Planctomycetota bacterium]|nr:flagellar motor protein MotB [Planctomycetota bacterium]